MFLPTILLLVACGGGTEVEPPRGSGLRYTEREAVAQSPNPSSTSVSSTPTPTVSQPDEGWLTHRAMRRWQNRHGTEGLWITGYFLPRDWECYDIRSGDLTRRWKLVSKGGGDPAPEVLLEKALAALEGAAPQGLSNPLERVRLRVREAQVEGDTVYLDFGPGIYATNSMGTCGGFAMSVQFVATVHHFFPEKQEVCVLVEGTPSGKDGEALVFHDGVACPIPLHG